jgi:hypothetical protein
MTVIKSRFHSNREFIKGLDIDCFRKYFALGTIMNGKTKNLTQSSTLLIKKQHTLPQRRSTVGGDGGCRLLRFPLPSNWSVLRNIAITKARYEYSLGIQANVHSRKSSLPGAPQTHSYLCYGTHRDVCCGWHSEIDNSTYRFSLSLTIQFQLTDNPY